MSVSVLVGRAVFDGLIVALGGISVSDGNSVAEALLVGVKAAAIALGEDVTVAPPSSVGSRRSTVGVAVQPASSKSNKINTILFIIYTQTNHRSSVPGLRSATK